MVAAEEMKYSIRSDECWMTYGLLILSRCTFISQDQYPAEGRLE